MTDDERAALKAELKAEVLAELKAEQPKPKPQPSFEEMERDVARYNDERRAWSEARASQIPEWMHRAVGVAVSNVDAWDLAHHGTVQSPSQVKMGSQAPTEVRSSGPAGGPPRPFVPADDVEIDREARMRLALKNR